MPLPLPCLTCILSLPVGRSVRHLPARLPPGAPVRGRSARTGPTVWTRAAGPCASASPASAAPSVRSCSVSTSWTGTLTCSSLTCRTGRGPTSRCRWVPRAPVTKGSQVAVGEEGDPGLRSEIPVTSLPRTVGRPCVGQHRSWKSFKQNWKGCWDINPTSRRVGKGEVASVG